MIYLNCKTHGSILLSQTQPVDLAKYAASNAIEVGLCDVGSLSQCYHYWSAMKEADKKPVLGCEFKICSNYASITDNNPANKRLAVFAKNLRGWKDLLYIYYQSNQPANYYEEGRLSIEEIAQFLTNDLVVIGNDLSDEEWDTLKASEGDLYYGSTDGSPTTLGVPEIAFPSAFFLKKADQDINHALIATKFHSKDHPLIQQGETLSLEYAQGVEWSKEQKDNAQKVWDSIEVFDITNPEDLPRFECGELSETEFLKQECFRSLKELGLDNDKYIQRLNLELDVIGQAGMAGYFLVLSDITNYCREHDILLGFARGSAGGCLISYLMKIIKVDPLKYDLFFERFYSAARTEYPDIDIDIQPSRRSELEEYIKNKYGDTHFMQYATYSTLKGAAALKLALSNSDQNISVDEQNEITKLLPMEAKIAAELKEQNDKWENQSTILYSLLNEPAKLSKWCTLKVEDDKWHFDGMYAKEFELAIKLNTVIKARSRHASAFVLSPEPLYRRVPVCWDVGESKFVIDTDMKTGEKYGCVKIDLLGLILLDEYDYVRSILNGEV